MPTLVYIHWLDASTQRGNLTIEDLDPLIELHSAGLLVQENKQVISIATDYFVRAETWRDVTHIPKVNIKRIKRVKV